MHEKSVILTSTRAFLIKTVSDLSASQLNTIPAGFNNNIFWNMAHLVATFERIIYLRSGNTGSADIPFTEKFKNGTKPDGAASVDQINFVKDLLIKEMVQFDADYSLLKAAPYEGWKNSSGLEIETLDKAIDYLAFHEGMHTGVILALKRLV